MAPRVVSLVPSATETVRAWGVDPVACTRFCEQDDLPTVGGTKNPDVDAIAALRPDVVVVDDQENRREDADELDRRGVPVHVLCIRAVADVAPALGALANRLGLHDGAPGTLPLPPPAPVERRRRAFVPIWRRPWMTVDATTYGSSLLAHVGVDNVFADAGRPYPEVTLAEAAAAGADVVLAPSEPYEFGPRHVPELSAVAPVVLIDGRDLFWWGWRTPGAAERLAAQLTRFPEEGP